MPDESDLKDRLMTIDGVGESRADLILDYVWEYYNHSESEDLDRKDDVAELVAEAHDHHQSGEHQYAEKFVRRAHDQLSE